MIKYWKIVNGSNVVGMGYMNLDNDKDMLFEVFEEVEYAEHKNIEQEEFMELGKKHDFIGMRPNSVGIPTSI